VITIRSHLKMQMRTGADASCANFPNGLALKYHSTGFDSGHYHTEMSIAGANAIFVIYLNHATIRPIPIGITNCPILRC